MARLLLLTVVLIAYGSLYPWHFRHAAAVSATSFLYHSWPHSLDVTLVKDVAVNVLIYLPLGLFAFLTFAALGVETLPAVAAALLIGILLSFSAELAQAWVVGRVSSTLDIASNTLGSAIGAAAGILSRRSLQRPFQRPDAEFLLCCWVAYQCFPFLPHLTHVGRLVSANLADTVFNFAQQAALVPLVLSIRGSRLWSRTMITGLLLLVPLKLFIFTRAVGSGEIAAAIIILAASFRIPFPPRPFAAILAAALLLHGFAPFRFSAVPHDFSWVPFQASFVSEWEYSTIVLLGKVFAYGALVWLLRESGLPLPYATALTAALLATIEVVQVWLPGRTSEITDPVIAGVLGWVFGSLRPRLSGAASALSKCSGP